MRPGPEGSGWAGRWGGGREHPVGDPGLGDSPRQLEVWLPRPRQPTPLRPAASFLGTQRHRAASQITVSVQLAGSTIIQLQTGNSY